MLKTISKYTDRMPAVIVLTGVIWALTLLLALLLIGVIVFSSMALGSKIVLGCGVGFITFSTYVLVEVIGFWRGATNIIANAAIDLLSGKDITDEE